VRSSPNLGAVETNKRKYRCKKCKGEKTVKEKTRQEIFVEKGMTDRQRIVLAGAGDQKVFSAPLKIMFLSNGL
jgi:DnaJ family protein A protein 2